MNEMKKERRDTKFSDKYGEAIYLGDTLQQGTVHDVQIGTPLNETRWTIIEDEFNGKRYFCGVNGEARASMAFIAPISKKLSP